MIFWYIEKTLNYHIYHLQELLQILKENELYIKVSKCDFGKAKFYDMDHKVMIEKI